MHNSHMILIALASMQDISPPSISTPNNDLEFNERVKLLKKNLLGSESKKISISKELYVPTIVTESSVENFQDVKRRFDDTNSQAVELKAESFARLPSKFFLPPSCAIVGNHPSGVQRISDMKYNGISILIDCSDKFYQVDYSDFSEPLSQIVRKELSEKFYSINGGYVSTSYAKSSDGRARRDFSAIGGKVGVNMVMQSKIPIIQNEKSLDKDIKIIESIIEYKK